MHTNSHGVQMMFFLEESPLRLTLSDVEGGQVWWEATAEFFQIPTKKGKGTEGRKGRPGRGRWSAEEATGGSESEVRTGEQKSQAARRQEIAEESEFRRNLAELGALLDGRRGSLEEHEEDTVKGGGRRVEAERDIQWAIAAGRVDPGVFGDCGPTDGEDGTNESECLRRAAELLYVLQKYEVMASEGRASFSHEHEDVTMENTM